MPDDAPQQRCVLVAIETTGRCGSVAVLAGEKVLRQTNLPSDRRTAATLAPQLDATLRWCCDRGERPQAVAVADGPGSFTGLRIAVTAAKSFSYALDLPLISVDSLAAIAAAAMHDDSTVDEVLVALDAYRSQIYAGHFARRTLIPPLLELPTDWTAHPDSVQVLARDQWIVRRDHLADRVRFSGDDKLNEGNKLQLASRRCDAIGVGLLAARALQVGGVTDPLQLVPRYLKPSAAEEKANQAEA